MIEVDGGDDSELGLDDVGCVEPPAQSGLDHGDLDGRIAEEEERHRSDSFKVRRVIRKPLFGDHPLRSQVDAIEGRGKLGGGHLASADLDPLGRLDQVGRGVEAGSVPGHS